MLDGTELTTEEMQRFAHWTNLSETTFVLPPSEPGPAYGVRIFTPVAEPRSPGIRPSGRVTWFTERGSTYTGDTVLQECAAGLIRVRRTPDGLAFVAPPLLRSGPLEESLLQHVAGVLGIDRAAIVDAEWAGQPSRLVAVQLASADEVLALRPGFVDLDVGVVGPYRRARRRRSRCEPSS